MKAILGITIIFVLGLATHISAQVSTNQSSSNDFTAVVEKQLHEVFGDYYSEYIEGKDDMKEYYSEFYSRCEFISMTDAPSDIENVSGLMLIEKYNPEFIQHDGIDVFEESEFNVLKYRINYQDASDQYYRIYNTDVVLKINGKK